MSLYNVSSLPQSPPCNVNIVRLFRLPLPPLPVFGRLFFFLHPRGHKPTAPFTYCAIIPDPRVKSGGYYPVPRDAKYCTVAEDPLLRSPSIISPSNSAHVFPRSPALPT